MIHNKTTDVRTLVQQYNDGTAEIMDKHAPIITKKIKLRTINLGLMTDSNQK